ncbi:MAG: hypothetical protein ACJA2O_001146, partial [Candidatus Azotimanducaceae bacterium]
MSTSFCNRIGLIKGSLETSSRKIGFSKLKYTSNPGGKDKTADIDKLELLWTKCRSRIYNRNLLSVIFLDYDRRINTVND